MSNHDKIILVTGATGQQGGATARHLLAAGWSVRALTRDAAKPAAQALRASGAEVVQGDFDDRVSLDRALAGVYGVFSVQTPLTQQGVAVADELRQGKALAEAARATDVRHLVYTSSGGAERNTGVPHVESKWAIEQYMRALGLPLTVLRPVFFMDNFAAWPRQAIMEGSLSLALRPTTRLQMIASDDIGVFAMLAFNRPQEFMHQALEIAGDELTMPQAAAVFSQVIGRPVQFVEQPIEEMRSYSPEMASTFDWFNEHGNQADIPALRTMHPGLLTLEAWLRKTSWAPSTQASVKR